MEATRTILAHLLAALQGGVAAADTFVRYDGELADAIDEHVVSLPKPGASVLVGFLADEVREEDESGELAFATLRPSVAVVIRRGPRQMQPATAATADAERLDDLYDAAARACVSAGWRLRRGLTVAGDTRDWLARALVVETTRAFPPDALP